MKRTKNRDLFFSNVGSRHLFSRADPLETPNRLILYGTYQDQRRLNERLGRRRPGDLIGPASAGSHNDGMWPPNAIHVPYCFGPDLSVTLLHWQT